MNFKEEIFEIAFGDNAINKDYTEKEVISKIREFSDLTINNEQNKFNCPNCKEIMILEEKNKNFQQLGICDKWICKYCSHIHVLDWRNENTKEIQKFKLPYMILYRQDLEEQFTKEQIKNISDDTMEEIAKKLSNALMNDWNLYLNIILNDIKKEVNKQ